MTTVTFLLSKDPETTHGGDLTLSRLLVALAETSSSVTRICLSPTPAHSTAELTRVHKPEVSPARIALRSLRGGKSLVHTRFDVDALVPALENSSSDVYIADHSYMAEPYLRSALAESSAKLLVNTVISESLVWKSTRGVVGRLDTPRIRRDELRVARAAHSVGTYDAEEVDDYRRAGITNIHWLDLTLPPAEQVAVADSQARLVFLGDRTWPPNDEAFRLLLQWWPDIAWGIDAELLVIGKRGQGKQPELPEGATDLGFADDLDAVLGTARALVAPILTGGGVRVKMLDCASRGLPIVGTRAGVGSLASVFGLGTFDTREEFIARCRELLLDRAAAVREGDRLYAANRDRWMAGAPQSTVEKWLAS